MRTLYVAIVCCCVSFSFVIADHVPTQTVPIPRFGKRPPAGADQPVFKISFPKDMKLENAPPKQLPVFRTARSDFTDEFMSVFSHAVCTTMPDEIHRSGQGAFAKTAKGPFVVEYDRDGHYINVTRVGASARRHVGAEGSGKALSREEMSKMASAVLDRHGLNFDGAIPIFWHYEDSSQQVYVKIGRNAPGTALPIMNNSIDVYIGRDGLLDSASIRWADYHRLATYPLKSVDEAIAAIRRGDAIIDSECVKEQKGAIVGEAIGVRLVYYASAYLQPFYQFVIRVDGEERGIGVQAISDRCLASIYEDEMVAAFRLRATTQAD